MTARFELGDYELVVAPLSVAGDCAGDADSDPLDETAASLVGTLIIDSTPYAVLLTGRKLSPSREADTAGHSLCDELTKRELQIAILVAAGKANKQIAYQLEISEWTVSTHLRRIFAKLGVHSRAAMAAYVATHGPASQH
jgi:DNA-binding NarL/FixJ family response regulator